VITAISIYKIAIFTYFYSIIEPAIATNVQYTSHKTEIVIRRITVVTFFTLEVWIESSVMESVTTVSPVAVVTDNTLVIILLVTIIAFLRWE
jgi:hypothetical protein